MDPMSGATDTLMQRQPLGAFHLNELDNRQIRLADLNPYRQSAWLCFDHITCNQLTMRGDGPI